MTNLTAEELKLKIMESLNMKSRNTVIMELSSPYVDTCGDIWIDSKYRWATHIDSDDSLREGLAQIKPHEEVYEVALEWFKLLQSKSPKEPKITKTFNRGNGDGTADFIGVVEGKEVLLFNYYLDEHMFANGELVGMTKREAINSLSKRDGSGFW